MNWAHIFFKVKTATSKVFVHTVYDLVLLMWISYSAPVRPRKHCKSQRIFMLCLIARACILSKHLRFVDCNLLIKF